MSKFEISIVIPAYNDGIFLGNVIRGLLNQTYKPNEIIIIDSSKNTYIKDKVLPNFKKKKIKIIYKKITRSFAGKSTNIGVKLSTKRWIGLLDTKTIPSINWIKSYIEEIRIRNNDVIFGVTKFNYKSNFQRYIKATSYGNIGHQTLPGTIIRKSCFIKSGGIIENIRAGYDIEWRETLINNFKCYTPSYAMIYYSELPKDIIQASKKYIQYSYHTSKVDVQKDIKNLYLSSLILILIIIIPKWNYWTSYYNLEFINLNQNTKIVMIILLIFAFSFSIFQMLLSQKSKSLFMKLFKTFFILITTFILLRWNAVIANWVEDSIWYFPHITKIYVSLIISFLIFYRGLFRPLWRSEPNNFIFPFNWIKIGFIGLLLDIVKAPGYIFGSIVKPFIRKRKNINN